MKQLGFFKMFKKPKTDITLELPNTTYTLGSSTTAKIIVSSKEEFDSDEIRAEIRCIEKQRRERWVYNRRLRRNIRHEYWDVATLYSEDTKASGPIHIVPGFRKAFPISIYIPQTGRETYDSIDTNITWTIKGVVAVDDRPDSTSETIELQITKPSNQSKEVTMVPCQYCRTLIPTTSSTCPICGAPRKN
jgi:hypothetical protein